MTSVPSHVTPLRLAQRVAPQAARACPPPALVDTTWLGSPVESPHPGARRYLTDLSLPVREHSPSITFSKAAFVDVGVAQKTAEGCEMEIGWRSSSLAPLFPVFAGRLVVTPTEIRLEGFYAPPGGEVGAALDRAFLGIAARGTARWFLGRIAAALAGAPATEAAGDGAGPASLNARRPPAGAPAAGGHRAP